VEFKNKAKLRAGDGLDRRKPAPKRRNPAFHAIPRNSSLPPTLDAVPRADPALPRRKPCSMPTPLTTTLRHFAETLPPRARGPVLRAQRTPA
jgi:hypothetical protein